MSVCVDETCESVVGKSAIDRSAGEMSRGCGVVRAGCVRGWLPREKRRLGSAGAGTLKPRSCSSVGQIRHRPRLRLQVPYEVGAPPPSSMPARKQPPKHLLLPHIHTHPFPSPLTTATRTTAATPSPPTPCTSATRQPPSSHRNSSSNCPPQSDPVSPSSRAPCK